MAGAAQYGAMAGSSASNKVLAIPNTGDAKRLLSFVCVIRKTWKSLTLPVNFASAGWRSLHSIWRKGMENRN